MILGMNVLVGNYGYNYYDFAVPARKIVAIQRGYVSGQTIVSLKDGKKIVVPSPMRAVERALISCRGSQRFFVIR